MTGYDASEGLTPFRDDSGYGAILFDRTRVRQASPEWFSPAFWNERARPVDSGGRGGAWFVDAPFGPTVLRRYLRGGLVARFNRDRYWWRGAHRTRSFAEFRLTREVARKGLPVPMPVAAWYRRDGLHYYAAILIERLGDVRSLADRAAVAGDGAPWEEAGRLIARCHRAGLDHADLNATNLLFDSGGRGFFEAGDVVQMGMGDEQRARRLAVVRQIGGQALAAAVDGQPGRAVALDGRHRRTQFHRRRVADAVQAQMPAHQYPLSQARS